MRALWAEIKALCAEAWRVARDHRIVAIAGFAVVAVITALALPHDQAWTNAIRDGYSERSLAIADFFSDWGDYPLGPLVVLGLLVVASFALKRPSLRRIGLAVVLAATFSGLVAISLRTLVGRPRPRSDKPDGIYGPSFEYELNSFPSGHTACAYATAFALVPALPVIGIPAVLFATGTAWSRIHSYHHHPTDVLAAGAFGALFGLSFGAAARRRNRATRLGASVAAPFRS